MSFAIPVKRLRETEYLMAFWHPKPVYPVHILLVPKKAIASLNELTPADDPFLGDVFRITQELVQELGLGQGGERDYRGFRLILNGGAYQDVPQLHFHLVAE